MQRPNLVITVLWIPCGHFTKEGNPSLAKPPFNGALANIGSTSLVNEGHCDPFTNMDQLQLIEAEWRIYASVNKPLLVQIMACRLASAKPLYEPTLEYC